MAGLIEARGLVIGHAGKPILSGIDFGVQPGEVLCLLGPNGVGKTTLFRTMLGLLPKVGGHLHVQGRDIASLDRRQIAACVAYVPQAQTLPFAFSARDIVLMGRSAVLGPFAQPSVMDEALCDAAFDRLGIVALLAKDMTRLSGGQQQLVLIARALVQAAPAMVLDEPTASLDLGNQHRIIKLLRRLACDGIGIVLSTHDPDQAALLADRVLMLGADGVVANGAVAETMTAEALSATYGAPIRRERLRNGQLHFRVV